MRGWRQREREGGGNVAIVYRFRGRLPRRIKEDLEETRLKSLEISMSRPSGRNADMIIM